MVSIKPDIKNKYTLAEWPELLKDLPLGLVIKTFQLLSVARRMCLSDGPTTSNSGRCTIYKICLLISLCTVLSFLFISELFSSHFGC